MAKYGKSILLAPIADGDQETTTSASGSLTLYVTGTAGGQTPMLALKKNGVADQRIVATNEFNLQDGNGIADFTFDGTANATIAVELKSTNALTVDGSGLELNDTITGARTFSDDISFSSDINANGNIVGDGSTRVSGIQHFTASYAKIDVLDVNEINSVTRTESTLEVQDKLIIAGSGSGAAAASGGGLQIGGTNDGNAVAAVLYDNGNSALDFNIGTETQIRLEAQKLLPEANNDVDLGSDALEYKDLYLEGAAYLSTLGRALDANAQNITNVGALEVDGLASFSGTVDLGNNAASDQVRINASISGNITPEGDNKYLLGGESKRFKEGHIKVLHADSLGQALDAASQNITNVNNFEVDGLTSLSGALGVVGAAEFKGDVQLGEASSDTVTVTSRFASDLVPSTDSVRALGSSALQWSAIHVDVGHIDQLGSDLDCNNQAMTNVDINSGAIDGTAIGLSSRQAGRFTTLGATGACEFGDAAGDVITLTGQVTASAGVSSNELHVSGLTEVNTLSATGNVTLGNASSDVITLAGQVSSSAGITTNELQVSSFAQVATYVGTAQVFASTSVVLGNGYAAGGSTLASNGNISAAGNLIAAGQSSSFGASDSAATVQFFGADQDGVEDGKERMEYLGRDNVLRFVDNNVEIMAIGGNDITDFAIDVHDNTGNQGKIRCTELVIHSDRSLKKDIKPMTDALDRVLKLQPVTYELKSNPGKADLGFIAQEVAQSVPEVCHFERGESRGLDYSRLSALLAGAVKSQQEQIDSLKAIVAKLQK